ncbi:MAG: DUF1937 family protein [Wolinella sp.]
MRGKLVYLASPFRAITCSERDRLYYARRVALEEAKKLKSHGYIPLSPVLLFGEIYNEQKERELALKAGLALLETCDYIYVSTHRDAKNSEGIKAELAHAEKLGIIELRLELF